MLKNLFVFLSLTVLLVSSCATVQARHLETEEISVSSDDATIVDMINQINESMLFAYHHGLMKFGPRYTGSLNCSLAATYIYESFQDM